MTPVELSALFDAHPVATFTVDATGKVTSWNAAMAALTGRSAAEVVGQRAWKGFSPKRIPLPVDEAFAEAGPIDAAFSFARPGGGTVDVRFAVRPTPTPRAT